MQISPVDTFNTEDYKRICCDYLNTYKESEQTADSLFKEVTDRIKKYPTGSIARMPNSDEFKMLFLTSANLTKQQIELAEQDDFIAPSMPDVIASQNDTTIISYSIKYRYETSNGLKIDYVFANSNASNSQILICKELSPECFGEDNAKFKHNFTKSCISWKVLIDLNCKKIKNSKQMIEWLDNLGK